MRKPRKAKFTTRKGAASFYVVIFTTLILSIMTLSFVRIMLNEATRTADADLNQSAYDSALAGVEDAKSALLKCTREGTCDKITWNECNSIGKVLYNLSDEDIKKEVAIAEHDTKNGTESQAYTCVKLFRTLEDYRARFSSEVHIKVIPLNVVNASDEPRSPTSLIVRWYSALNGTQEDIDKLHSRPNKEDERLTFGKYGVGAEDQQDNKIPPVLSAELVQTGPEFSFDDLIKERASTGAEANRSMLQLYPVKGNNKITFIDKQKVADAGDSKVNTNTGNQPFYVDCNAQNGQEFACNAEIELPSVLDGKMKNNSTAFLILATPYDTADVDFAITAKEGKDTELHFRGAQYGIDSTGRANDIYRRIETRIELGDFSFPYPEYVTQIGAGSGASDTSKNFWVTNNCWQTHGEELGGQYGTDWCRNAQSGDPINSGNL